MSDSSEGVPASLRDKIVRSIDGQKPSWKNVLSRKVVGRRSSVDSYPEKIEEIPATAPAQEQSTSTEINFSPIIEYFYELGKKPLVSLEKMIGIPEGSRSQGNVIANLVANNCFEEETETSFIEQGLDGHLIGVGAASIFCMIEGFSECQSFTGIDVHPSPVAIGRVITELLGENDTFEDFFTSLSDEDKLKDKLEEMGLPEGYFDETAQSVKDAITQYNKVKSSYPGMRAEGFNVHNMDKKNLFPLKSIERHYKEFMNLARSGNMHFIQADFLDSTVWRGLNRAAPQIKDANNLIFCSNAIDHEFRSRFEKWDQWSQNGKVNMAISEQVALGGATAFNFADWESSRFVFTLTSLRYELQLTDEPPVYGYDEQQGRPTLIN